MAVHVDLRDVSVRRPDRPLFEHLSVTVGDGDRVGVVGINGTGKSTLLRVAAGALEPDAGTVTRGRATRVGYLPQEPQLPEGSVAAAVGPGWEAEAALERLGMGGQSARPVGSLSGGQTKRVALARVLATPTELLVLDEPTNHLDVDAVGWLEEQLAAWRGGLLLVTHDRYVLDRVCTRVLELDRGRSYEHDGGYAGYLEARALREAQASAAEATRANLARRELAWLRRGAPARSRKPRARIEAATALVTARAEAPARSGALQLAIGTPRLGDKVIEVEAAAAGHEVGAPVLHDVDLSLDPRERLGVVGANGSGKSTLLDLLAGRLAPAQGRVDTGTTVVVGYYRQSGPDIDPAARVRDLVAGPARAPGGPEDVALMERFWFGGDLAWSPAGSLSGGERRRLALFLVLASRPNVLLLDEPTNDLDLDSLRVLEDFLDDWPGAVVAVSHDRTFLRRATERLVRVDGGRVTPLAGGIDAWLASLRTGRTRAGTAGPAPVAPSAKGPGSGRLLRDLEKSLARLERRRDDLAARLATTSDHVEAARLASDLAEVSSEVAATEDRWLEAAG